MLGGGGDYTTATCDLLPLSKAGADWMLLLVIICLALSLFYCGLVYIPMFVQGIKKKGECTSFSFCFGYLKF